MKRYIFFVTESFSVRLLTSFRQWREIIEFIISPNLSNEPIFEGINVYKPDELMSEMFGNIPIVLLDDSKTPIVRFPSHNKTRVITRRQWVIEMLENPSIQLSPENARLDICTRCQLNCTSCYMRTDKEETTGIGHVKPSLFETFLVRNPSVRRIEISNSGEPFLHPQMHEILDIAHKHNVSLKCTNGSNFNYVTDQVLEDLVNYGFETIHIALDGASQETYSIYRRNGNFDKVIANIRKLNEIKKQKKSERPKLVWQFVVMSHNYEDVPRVKEMAKELGMSMSFRDTWDPEERSRLEIMLSKGETERYESKSLNNRIVADSKETFNLWCRDMLMYPQINWDGRLLGCCQVYRSDWGINVFDRGLIEALNSNVYRETLLALLKATPLPYRQTPCYACEQRPKTVEEAESIVAHYAPIYQR